MSVKTIPQTKTSSTPIPQVQAASTLGQTRAFTDSIETLEQESTTSDLQRSISATSPPPEKPGDRTPQNSYNFSRISISDYVPAIIQSKLVVGAPGDPYEQEADRMADQVMAMSLPVQKQEETTEEEPEVQTKPIETIQLQETETEVSLKPLIAAIQLQETTEKQVKLKPVTGKVQRQEREENGTVYLKPLANKISLNLQRSIKEINRISRKEDGSFTANESIETRIKSTQGSGDPLPNETRDFMESRFGNDFGNVKIHTGSQAIQLNQELRAQAFTHGENIYFNSGKYEPHSDPGKKLLAHELTHTIQQTGSKIKTKPLALTEKPNKLQRQTSSDLAEQVTLDNNPGFKVHRFFGGLVKAGIKLALSPVKWFLNSLIGDIAGQVIDAIVDNPGQFIGNLFKGIGDGFKNFFSNIGKHLINGLVSWLFGNLGEIKLPETFDLKGFLDILLQLIGATKEHIFELAEQFLGSDIVELIKFVAENGTDFLGNIGKNSDEDGDPNEIPEVQLEAEEGAEEEGGIEAQALTLVENLSPSAKFIFDLFVNIMQNGIGGVWDFIKSSLGTLKTMLMDELQGMVIMEIIEKAVVWIASLLIPGAGAIKAGKAIVDVIKFFIERKEQIKSLVQTIISTIKLVLEGNVQGMAEAIENAMSKAIPMVLGFLASLLGVSGIPSKIKKIFEKLRGPVDKIIGGLFEKVGGLFKGAKEKKKKRRGKRAKTTKSNRPKSSTTMKGQSAGSTTPKRGRKGGATKGNSQQNKSGKTKKEKVSNSKKTKDFIKQVGSEMADSLSSDLLNQNEENQSEDNQQEASENQESDEVATVQEMPERSAKLPIQRAELSSGFHFSHVAIQAQSQSDRLNHPLTTGNTLQKRELTPIVQRSHESPQTAPPSVNSLFSGYAQQRTNEQAPHFVQKEGEEQEKSNHLQLKILNSQSR